jgi:hypothetical protein
MEAVPPHGFDMRRPLVDQGDIEARLDEIGGNAAAVGSGAENRYFLAQETLFFFFFVSTAAHQ